MRIYYFSGFLIAAMIGAGCWSMSSNRSRAETRSETPIPNSTVSATATASPTPVPSNSNSNTMSGDFRHKLPTDFEMPTDDAGKLLLKEYGAVFVARNGAVPPNKVVFKDEADVLAYQRTLSTTAGTIGGYRVEVQTVAMNALKAAISDARNAGLSIGPRASDSSRRGYNQTVGLWASRVDPGMAYWVRKGRVTAAEAARIKALSPYEQVPEILRLEQDGIYFAKSLDKSIIYSVAPPGTSQHISMLALDVAQFNDARVRAILADHGWFQTVASDLPHFTYIGVTKDELPALGLKRVMSDGREFWVPDI